MLRVKLLGERRLLRRCDIVADRRIEGGQLEPGDDLVLRWPKTRIEMMEVHRVGVARSLLPEVTYGLRHEAEHASHALEVGEGRELVRQDLHQRRMKRITGQEIGCTVLVDLLSRQVAGTSAPEIAVGFGHF